MGASRPGAPKQTTEPTSRAAAYRAAIGLLEHRDRSTADLRKRLLDRGYDPDTVEETMARLGREGFVDDVRFAERYASSMRELRGYGTQRIGAELAKRGIDREVAAAATAIERSDERALCEALALKRARSLPASLPQDQALRRLAGYLGRKGFGADLVWAAAKHALASRR